MLVLFESASGEERAHHIVCVLHGFTNHTVSFGAAPRTTQGARRTWCGLERSEKPGDSAQWFGFLGGAENGTVCAKCITNLRAAIPQTERLQVATDVLQQAGVPVAMDMLQALVADEPPEPEPPEPDRVRLSNGYVYVRERASPVQAVLHADGVRADGTTASTGCTVNGCQAEHLSPRMPLLPPIHRDEVSASTFIERCHA